MILVSGCAPRAAADNGGVNEDGTITVSGYGAASGSPDQVRTRVGVETFGESLADATSQNEMRVQAAVEALVALGIAPEDIRVTRSGLWAEQTYDEFGPSGIVGYHISSQIDITMSDIQAVSDVLQATTSAGANNIYAVFYEISDTTSLESEARAAALQAARGRTQALAELLDVELGEVRAVRELVDRPALFEGIGSGRVEFAGGGAASGISPGQLDYSIQLQVTYSITN